MLAREDVGRHNAVDKVIGAAARRRIATGEHVLFVSGRTSLEIVQKAAACGCRAGRGVGADVARGALRGLARRHAGRVRARRAAQRVLARRTPRRMKLAELIRLQHRCHGKERLLESVGDGYSYVHNPYFRRVRKAALAAGFRFTQRDPNSYFGFPPIHLDSILAEREIPYRPSFTALLHLERTRPGHFELRDLFKNRPAPNYLLHESAHAVTFARYSASRADVRAAFVEPQALVRMMLGESYAMTAEYFAACAVEGSVHDWFFSISSYRHRTPKKKRDR